MLSFLLVLAAHAAAIEREVASQSARWDRAAAPKGAISAAAGSPSSSLRLDAPVSARAVGQVHAEVLGLRDAVWAGKLEPKAFYPAVEAMYRRKFGADYEAKLKTFLDGEAAKAPVPSGPDPFAGMTPEQRAAFFEAMPKGGELHIHLTGAIKPETMMAIGESLGTRFTVENVAALLRVPDLSSLGVAPGVKSLAIAEMPAALREAVTKALVSRDGEDFMKFLDKWRIIGPISMDPRSVYPMLRAVADEARAQNIQYLEIMLVAAPDALKAAVAAAKRVQAETGVTVRLMGHSSWNQDQKIVDEWLAAAESDPEWIVGYNMVADERISPLNHYESFRRARERLSKLSISLHAGEQPGTARNIVDDLLLGPTRYGHATHVQENPVAAATLYASRMPVEVSLISNQKTHVMDDLGGHPLRKLLAWKIPVVLSTDDPGVFESTLAKEFDLAQRQFGLSWGELKELARNSIRHAFADPATKARLLRELESRLRKFERSPAFRPLKP